MDHFIHSWGVDPRLMRDLPSTLSLSGFSSVSQLSLHTLVLPVLPHEHHNVQYVHMELFKVDSSASSYGHRVATRAVDLYEAEYGPTLGFRCFGE